MNKNKSIILKFGGSIITQKFSGRPQIKKAIVWRLAKELKQFIQRSPKTKIVLLHGAGSFGHPLVLRYQLLKHPLAGSRLLGFAETVRSMRHMANLLTDIFKAAKLPVLPLQASAVLNEKGGAMFLFDLQHIKQILVAGFIPLLGGDMGLTKRNQAIVVSADRLAVLLGKALPNSRIIFATNVDGVFDKFPPSDNREPYSFLSRKNLKQLLGKMTEQKNKYDTTGGMVGKLRTLLSLQGREVIIFNGLQPGALFKALSGKPVGTLLRL